MKPILHLGDYVIYQEYYKKVLCINQDKPKMKCDGKCALSARLNSNQELDTKKTQSSENRIPIQQNLQSIEYWLLEIINIPDYFFSHSNILLVAYFAPSTLLGYLSVPFYPPKY